MRRLTQKLDFGKRTFVTLTSCACWHIGNPCSLVEKIRSHMLMLRRKGWPWMHLGDMIEAITPIDKRFCGETHRDTIFKQLQGAAELVRLARDTCIGLMIGNHEDKLCRVIGDPVRDICSRVWGEQDNPGSRWLGGLAMLRLQCPDGVCDVLATHSRLRFSNGTSDPDRDLVTAQIKLRRYLSGFEADLKLAAHTHRPLIAPPIERTVITAGENKRVKATSAWCAVTPSMLETYNAGDSEAYPAYSELEAYPHSPTGWIEADIDRRGAVRDVRFVEA